MPNHLTFAFVLILTGLISSSHSVSGQSPSGLKSQVAPDIALIGVVSVPANELDCSGLTGQFDNGISHAQFGGISGLDYEPGRDCYWAISDRGPNDGAVDWICRMHRLKITAGSDSRSWKMQLLETVLLKDVEERTFSGSSAAQHLVSATAGRLDPEGIRLVGDSLMISDEYGPYLNQFSKSGKQVGRLEVPEMFKIQTSSADEAEEMKVNTKGRRPNRGMEGLAVDGNRRMFGLMQSPLIQDSQRQDDGSLKGLNCRLLAYDENYRPASQFVYRLDAGENKLNEILWVNENRFLTIERDGKAGSEAGFKKIMLINLKGATNVADQETLPLDPDPDLQPVSKMVFIDLLAADYGLAGESFPEKDEGLSWGPDTTDGRRTLIVAVDNDFEPATATQFWIFTVRPQFLLRAN